ncbi:MAG: hypothetical protein ACTH1W_06405, partial [Advenella sp.]
MKLITLVTVAAVATALGGCSFFEKLGTSKTAATTQVRPGISTTPVKTTGAGNLQVYVGSTTAPKATKGKSSKTIPLQVGDQTYQGVGPILTSADIKNVFVTKAGDRPALGLRVTPEGARKLNAEISGKSVKGKMVLASLNDSIFSTTIASPGAVDDGVLLMPM